MSDIVTTSSVTTASLGTYLPLHPAQPPRTPYAQLSDEDKKLRKSAETLVAQTFYAPMLKEMRESPFKSKMFDGGRGGEAFTAMLDQKFTEHASNGAGGALVDSIVKKFHNTMAANAAKAARKAADAAKAAAAPTTIKPGDAHVEYVG